MNDAQVMELLRVLNRIEAALVRIAEAQELSEERAAYDSALMRWEMGQGKHPDD